MKFVGSQLAYYLSDRDFKRNSKVLLKYLVLLVIVIVIFSVLFHFIMEIEGQNHSWITGFYWTLTVMSTLGFGDITFESDLGRFFSIVVLLSGIFMLLIFLPFAFIRHFYVPLLESKKKNRVPRSVPQKTKDHILICSYDVIARDFTERLKQDNAPYYIIEKDPEKALKLYDAEVPVLLGELDMEETFLHANIKEAKLVLVNRDDILNTKIILIIRNLAPHITIVALATDDESVDVQQLSGADHVLPIKRWLGEQLANRVNAQHAKSQPIGQYENLLIAELTIQHTTLVSKTIRETKLRQKYGVSIVGIWERGILKPITGNEKLSHDSVLVIIGKEEQLLSVDEVFYDYKPNPNPVLVIGGGKVGLAAAQSLHKNGVSANLIDKEPALCKKASPYCNEVFAGLASDYELLKEAGIMDAPSVLLSTHDDAMNIHLASYCRKLNKEVRIVSRITKARNIDIIHRAGANFVLSYATLGSEAVLSISKGQELNILGEGIKLFSVAMPQSLAGKSLAESGIGAKTGLSVIAIKENSEVETLLSANTILPQGAEIIMLGNIEMRDKFNELFVTEN
ncbi:potassium channel family protein [Aequorivita viscosa]|uniref:Trk K+ transport system, NAD-binding component n=1 Tax=Aequorivita viscosa TaxID=797419 RepID=A0A1M6GY17_9FLAO|nr:potassium channel family protein [Aequorivita viscosa]SDW79810.1 Trk K+ transport system, NAD-binding component [Aequorivita viscosa]SHJ14841.1 Trk K+ transport system, NAD-binding component [Aequorivita viscosa]